MIIHHQLAAYATVPAAGVRAAARQAMRMGADPRPMLRDLLARRYAADRVLLCASGTEALQVALAGLALASGPHVIVALPAFSCYDVATAALALDARIALYDLDPLTLSPDLASLGRALRIGARCVVVAPLYGIPIDWEGVEALAGRYDAVVIEDAAQGHGASWRNRRLGSLGRVSILSFGRGKGWTGGGGGAVLMRAFEGTIQPPDSSAAAGGDLATSVRLAAQFLLGRPQVYGMPRALPMLHLGRTRFTAPRRPRPMNRAAAAMLMRSVRPADAESAHRRAAAANLIAQLPPGGGFRHIRSPAAGVAGYLRLPVLIRGGGTAVRRAAPLGIERSYPRTLASLPAVAERLVSTGTPWPGADRLVRELVTLPTHSLVDEATSARIVATLRVLAGTRDA